MLSGTSPSMSQSRMSHSVRNTPAPPSPGGLTKCTVSAFADGLNGERVPATAPLPAAAASVPMKLRRLMDAPDVDSFDGFDFLLIFTPIRMPDLGVASQELGSFAS